MGDIVAELMELAKRKAAERQTATELSALDFGEPEKPPPSVKKTQKEVSADYVRHQRWRAEMFNKSRGNLDGYDCAVCLNRGCYYRADEHGHLISTPCKCMTIRKNQRHVEQSGLSDLLNRYTFEAWQTEKQWQAELLDGARRFAADPQGWFAVCGKPGTGKTHICTAICGSLMKRGYEVRYMLWRDAATRLKGYSAEDVAAYSREIEPLKTVKALYIDDFLKTGNRQKPTVMDVNLAFEIINARYNTAGLITIVSSELTMQELDLIDEATTSRIYERTGKGKNYFDLAGKENWRLEQTGGNYG